MVKDFNQELPARSGALDQLPPNVDVQLARTLARANEAKRCELDNGNVPQPPALSEADTADADAFLADLLLCLPVIGLSLFEKPATAARSDRDLFLRSKGIEARGLDGAEGFIFREGSTAVIDELPSIHAYLSDLRATLKENFPGSRSATRTLPAASVRTRRGGAGNWSHQRLMTTPRSATGVRSSP